MRLNFFADDFQNLCFLIYNYFLSVSTSGRLIQCLSITIHFAFKSNLQYCYVKRAKINGNQLQKFSLKKKKEKKTR